MTLEDVELPIWLEGSDSPELRQELVEYYRAIHRFDQGVGWVLEELSKRGLGDDTLILLLSDNGPPFVNAKATLYDSGTRLPFIVRVPGMKSAAGTLNHNLVSYVDILPTFLQWTGIDQHFRVNGESPPRIGRSILPIVSKSAVVPAPEWQDVIFCSHTFHQREQYWPTRVVRGQRYKYHRNIVHQLPFPIPTDLYASRSYEAMRNGTKPVLLGARPLHDYLKRPAEQLFDMENDPQELHNLAGKPEYQDILQEMRERLEAWQKLTVDFWLWRDGQSLTNINNWVIDADFMVPDRFDMDADQPETHGQIEGLKLLQTGGAKKGAY